MFGAERNRNVQKKYTVQMEEVQHWSRSLLNLPLMKSVKQIISKHSMALLLKFYKSRKGRSKMFSERQNHQNICYAFLIINDVMEVEIKKIYYCSLLNVSKFLKDVIHFPNKHQN